MKKNQFFKINLVCLIFIMTSFQTAFARPDSFAPIVKSEKEKVVHIGISAIVENAPLQKDPFFEYFFKDMPQNQRQSALGSGFIISSDGYIVTNNHVIEKADKIEVTLYNGEIYKATVVGKDKLSELALIKIDVKNLPYIKWGDSSKLEVGDWVLAIGNPLGLDHTVTAGILSGRGRNVFANTAYGQFLQTDAAINFGNSGGPLFNMDSEVIGINTAIVAGGQNIGFAIPSNLAQKVIDQLRKFGKVERGWFGVGIQDVDNELAESFGLPKGMKGVALNSIVKDSPGEKAGLKQGDVIVKFNGKALEKSNDLLQQVAESELGTKVVVEIFRQGRFLKKVVTVGKRPADDIESLNSTENVYGLRLVEISPENNPNLNLELNVGLLVYDIDQTGVAWEKGIRRGDVIIEANNNKMKKVDDFYNVMKEAEKTSRPVYLLINRNGREMFVALPVK
ncbi:Do family serine endopeptidase [bacterium]|nr:Do family serine endopeptidase [bacterium]